MIPHGYILYTLKSIMPADSSFVDFVKEKQVPIITIFIGVVLLWMGNNEITPFLQQGSDLTLSAQDDRTTWLIIFGIAALVAGFSGLIRRNVL